MPKSCPSLPSTTGSLLLYACRLSSSPFMAPMGYDAGMYDELKHQGSLGKVALLEKQLILELDLLSCLTNFGPHQHSQTSWMLIHHCGIPLNTETHFTAIGWHYQLTASLIYSITLTCLDTKTHLQLRLLKWDHDSPRGWKVIHQPQISDLKTHTVTDKTLGTNILFAFLFFDCTTWLAGDPQPGIELKPPVLEVWSQSPLNHQGTPQ